MIQGWVELPDRFRLGDQSAGFETGHKDPENWKVKNNYRYNENQSNVPLRPVLDIFNPSLGHPEYASSLVLIFHHENNRAILSCLCDPVN
jgi:hypothetical protein